MADMLMQRQLDGLAHLSNQMQVQSLLQAASFAALRTQAMLQHSA